MEPLINDDELLELRLACVKELADADTGALYTNPEKASDVPPAPLDARVAAVLLEELQLHRNFVAELRRKAAAGGEADHLARDVGRDLGAFAALLAAVGFYR